MSPSYLLKSSCLFTLHESNTKAVRLSPSIWWFDSFPTKTCYKSINALRNETGSCRERCRKRCTKRAVGLFVLFGLFVCFMVNWKKTQLYNFYKVSIYSEGRSLFLHLWINRLFPRTTTIAICFTLNPAIFIYTKSTFSATTIYSQHLWSTFNSNQLHYINHQFICNQLHSII